MANDTMKQPTATNEYRKSRQIIPCGMAGINENNQTNRT
jgi:hypothetical protein